VQIWVEPRLPIQLGGMEHEDSWVKLPNLIYMVKMELHSPTGTSGGFIVYKGFYFLIDIFLGYLSNKTI
jgi:hypothetical protein